MEFSKNALPISKDSSFDGKTGVEDKNGGLLNSATNSCRSAFRVIEDTVDEGVNAIVSGGAAVVNTVGDGGRECANVVEQGAKIVTDGIMDLTDIGVANIMRLISLAKYAFSIILKYKHYLETDSTFESSLALALWIFICYIFQLWMIPACVLVILVKNYIQRQLLGIPTSEIDEMLEEDSKETSIIEKLEAVEHLLSSVKNILGKVEITLGKIFQIFDVYLPQFFWTFILIQIVLTAVLMYIPVNYIIMLLGVILYAKRFSDNNTNNSNDKMVGIVPKKVSFSSFKRVIPDTMLEKHVEDVSDKTCSKCD